MESSVFAMSRRGWAFFLAKSGSRRHRAIQAPRHPGWDSSESGAYGPVAKVSVSTSPRRWSQRATTAQSSAQAMPAHQPASTSVG